MFALLVVLLSIALLKCSEAIDDGGQVTHLVHLNGEAAMTSPAVISTDGWIVPSGFVIPTYSLTDWVVPDGFPTAWSVSGVWSDPAGIVWMYPTCETVSLKANYFFHCPEGIPVSTAMSATASTSANFKAGDLTGDAATSSNKAAITPPPTSTYTDKLVNLHPPTTCLSSTQTCTAIWAPFGADPVSNAAVPRGQIFGVDLARFGYSYWEMPFLKPRSPSSASTVANISASTLTESVPSDLSEHQQDISSNGTTSGEGNECGYLASNVNSCEDPASYDAPALSDGPALSSNPASSDDAAPSDAPLTTCALMATFTANSITVNTQCAAVAYPADSVSDFLADLIEFQALVAALAMVAVCAMTIFCVMFVMRCIFRRHVRRAYPELYVNAPMPERWPHAARQTREEVAAQRQAMGESQADANGGSLAQANGASHSQANGESVEMQDMTTRIVTQNLARYGL